MEDVMDLPIAMKGAFESSQVLLAWAQWGVLGGFVLALLAAAWVFLDSRNAANDATLWKALAAVGTVLLIPFLLARFSADFAGQMAQSLPLLAYVSGLGLVLALVAAGAHTYTRAAV